MTFNYCVGVALLTYLQDTRSPLTRPGHVQKIKKISLSMSSDEDNLSDDIYDLTLDILILISSTISVYSLVDSASYLPLNNQ